MQTFSLQRYCGKINVFLAKGGFAAIYSTFASKTCRTAWHCFTTQRSKNAPPWKLTNVEWFQAIKFAYRECKGKNTTNLPTHETTYLLKYEKATVWHSYKAKKNQGLLCVKRKTIQKNLPSFLDATRGPPWNLQLFIIFRKRDRFLTTWREWNLVIQYCRTWKSIFLQQRLE